MKHGMYTVLIVICGFVSSVHAESDLMSTKEEQTKEFAYKKAITSTNLPDAKEFTERTVNWIKFEYVMCDAEWDQRCAGEQIIEAPPGWQACKPLYSVSTKMNSASYSVKPSKWYTNDPESPDRFRAYKFNYSAVGSGNIFDRWGSTMKLSNVGLQLISAEANNEARYSAGCSMPSHH